MNKINEGVKNLKDVFVFGNEKSFTADNVAFSHPKKDFRGAQKKDSFEKALKDRSEEPQVNNPILSKKGEPDGGSQLQEKEKNKQLSFNFDVPTLKLEETADEVSDLSNNGLWDEEGKMILMEGDNSALFRGKMNDSPKFSQEENSKEIGEASIGDTNFSTNETENNFSETTFRILRPELTEVGLQSQVKIERPTVDQPSALPKATGLLDNPVRTVGRETFIEVPKQVMEPGDGKIFSLLEQNVNPFMPSIQSDAPSVRPEMQPQHLNLPTYSPLNTDEPESMASKILDLERFGSVELKTGVELASSITRPRMQNEDLKTFKPSHTENDTLPHLTSGTRRISTLAGKEMKEHDFKDNGGQNNTNNWTTSTIQAYEVNTTQRGSASLIRSEGTSYVDNAHEVVPAIVQQLDELKKYRNNTLKLKVNLVDGSELSCHLRLNNNVLRVQFENVDDSLRATLVEHWSALTTEAAKRQWNLDLPGFTEHLSLASV